MEVRYNGILLNAPSTGDTSGYTSGNTVTAEADYYVSGNSITIPELSGGTRPSDVIQVTFVNSGETSVAGPTSAITINYIVTRVKAVLGGTYVPLPNFPHGDVQVTINGIALTKGTPQFTADYILDPANSTGGTNQIIIQNPDVIAFLNQNPDVQISYMHVEGSNDINLRSEVHRVDSFNTGKIYFNNSANKYVYKLNYRVNQASDIKFLIDGIALEPLTDYNINVQNPYEIFLPRGIRYGSVISAYYLVGGAGAFDPVINDVFGLGDISELSFLEFLELVQRKMINVRTRKIVTDFKGGWYPSILRLYEIYLERALLPDDNPLQSNGYTFQNLYPFLSKYNAFFQRFVDQLLSATIILRRGGLLIRNSIFTKQKHWYKRGVNVADGLTGNDLRGNPLVQYFGDDGSKFQIVQYIPPPPPPPTPLYVETVEGVLGSLTTGGRNIIGYDELTEYGVEYKLTYPYPYPYGGGSEPIGLENLLEGIDYEIEVMADNWTRLSQQGPLTQNSFSMTLTDLDEDTWYDYRAVIESASTGATGNTLSIQTDPPPLPTPSVVTRTATVVSNSLTNLGGDNVVRYDEVTYYAVQYRKQGSATWLYRPFPPAIGPLAVNNFSAPNAINLDWDSTYEYRAYIVVDGTAYYGTIKTAAIGSEPAVAYTVTTTPSIQALKLIDGTGFATTENTFAGGTPTNILRYGLVYTQNSSYSSNAQLRITNTNSAVKKTYLYPPPQPTSPFSASASGLLPGTQTWYRAFVENGTDPFDTNAKIGYGQIEDLITNTPPSTTYNATIEIDWVGGDSGVLHGDGWRGKIDLKQGSTVLETWDDYEISIPQEITRLHAFAYDLDDGITTYNIDLSYLVAYYSGSAILTDVRWREVGDINWTYSTTISGLSPTNKNFQIQVKDAPTPYP